MSGSGRGLLSIVSGNSPGVRGQVVDLLRRFRPDAAVLAVSIGTGDGQYPTVQRFTTAPGAQNAGQGRSGTGDPAVILRQDLDALVRRPGCPAVILALPFELDLLPFLADLWHAPIGTTALARHYELAPVTIGLDPELLLSDLRCTHRLSAAPGAPGDGLPVTVGEAAARQVEAAQTVLLARADDAEPELPAAARAVASHLNPSATVLFLPRRPDRAVERAGSALLAPVPPQAVAERLARVRETVSTPAWQPRESHGVRSVYWRARRPLHPQRLARAMPGLMRAVTRSRGHVWLASRPDTVVTWRSAGHRLELAGVDQWLPEPDAGGWPAASPERRMLATWHWDPYYGERRNEIVLIGAGLDEERLRGLLDGALLTDEELALGPTSWHELPDPILGAPEQGGRRES
ncbi:GTP-binding protein [Kitasatospora viridis]|uniref:G3E family GTPase n=1 Tax=Kitasatospora viridis TaxID=281105 RepID=A0A561TV78_9ACTN|nr:GTP-binding protein [Kitasatospora viridis]TWF91005.1 G3E family GTPase [Kitasatospora viridis]